MKSSRIVAILSACISMAMLSGCATKPSLLSNDFGPKDQSTVTVPKYQPSVIANSARMNLHPSDILLNVELYFTEFGGKQMVHFQYDPKAAKLRYTLAIPSRYTLIPNYGNIICKINYLAYNRLYSYNKVREVYEFHTLDKRIRYLPEFKGRLLRDVTVKHDPDNLLDPAAYQRLFTELASLDSSQRSVLEDGLDDALVNRIPSEDVKRYQLTIQSILKILAK